jgi:cytochrome P450
MSVPEVKGNIVALVYNFIIDPIGFLDQQFEEKGDVVKLKLVLKNFHATRNPKWMDHVFVKNHKNYEKDFSMEQIEIALGKGLLTNKGDSWFKQRRLAQPAFYKKRLEGLVDIMENLTDEHIAKFQKMRSGHKIYIDQEMLTLTASIVLETLLGEKMNSQLKEVQKTIAVVQDYIIKRVRIPFYINYSELFGEHKKFLNLISEMDEIIYEIIKRRKAHPTEDSNLISMLIEAEDADTGERMSDKQLRDELVTIYVAGHETSAYALSWTFYELMQNPDVVKKIKDEVSSIIQDGKIGSDGLKKLVYTSAVIQESMRLHPPAYFVSRVCAEDDIIDGVPISKNTGVLISIIAMHKHPDLWENPLKFQPERFLTPNEATRKFYHPFGAGPRMCIGNHFALMEITLILAKMIHHFDFKLVPNQKIVAQPMITLKPKYGIQLMKL